MDCRCGNKIVIWGGGKYYEKHIEKIEEKYEIIAIIDSYNSSCLKPKCIKNLIYDYVLIMVSDIKNLFDIIHELRNCYDIPSKKILFGQQLFDEDKIVRWGNVDERGRIKIGIKSYNLKISSYNEFYNVMETLWSNIYEYKLINDKKDIVFDIGMNIGDSTLFLLNNPKTEFVYAYEPFKETYILAEENLSEYRKANRCQLFQYGLSNVNEKRIIKYNENMPCAQSTNEEAREHAADNFEKRGLINRENDNEEEIEVRDASDALRKIIMSNKGKYNIVIKMDCEGEEYQIIDSLSLSGLLEMVDFIIIEWHYKGNKELIQKLEKAKFNWWHSYKSEEMGNIYAFRDNR